MPVAPAERFEKFFAATSDCQFYVKKDDDGRFRYVHVNPAALAVTGRAEEHDLIGLTPVEAMGEEYGATVENNIAEAFSQGRPYHFTGRLGSTDDGPVYDANYIPLRDSTGKIAGILGSARDITQISDLSERLLHAQRLEALGELSGGVAHDFNNILTILQSALRFLAQDDLEPAKRDVIFREANKALKNGAALTQRLTSFARKEKLQPKLHDVENLVSSCLFMMQRMLGKRIKLNVDFERGLWQARCDRNEFEIAMMNLVTNARDAIEAGGEVWITARNKVRASSDPIHYPEEYVEIAVRDNGRGMPPEVMDKAIEPFFSTKVDGHGTGLGLSGIAKFLNDVGGALRIESEVGKGTSVSLLLARDTP